MINFEYYISVYAGKEISDEKEFEKVKKQAVRFVKKVTDGKGTDEETADGVCALCEYLSYNRDRNGIKSETVDGVSITYDDTDIKKQMYDILKLYLPPELLYRGM